jgi:hypothetical protein
MKVTFDLLITLGVIAAADAGLASNNGLGR